MADSLDTPNPSAIPQSTTRRTILTAGAAAIGATAVAVPIPAVAGDDPIFAAIERHKAAWAHFGETADAVDMALAKQQNRRITTEDEAAHSWANAAELRAMEALCATAPTTLAGLAAALKYFIESQELNCDCEHFFETLLASPLLNEETRA